MKPGSSEHRWSAKDWAASLFDDQDAVHFKRGHFHDAMCAVSTD